MRNYMKIFNDVHNTMQNHYSGKDEKKDWADYYYYKEKINDLSREEKIDDKIFYDIVEDYLLEYKDGHIIWNLIGETIKNCGFKVRRCEEGLYVTEVLSEELKVKKGWKILKIDGKDIQTISIESKNKLRSDIYERQSWNRIVNKSENILFETDEGEKNIYYIRNIENIKYNPKFEIKLLDKNILYMCYENFADPEIILNLVKENKKNLESTPYWIIDVRKNSGGVDTAYNPLLPYLFSEGEVLDYDDLYFLMTEKNCEIRLKMIEPFLDKCGDDLEMKKELEKFISLIENNRGKGFIKESFPAKYFNKTKENPRKVVVITDTFCGSSGDQFICDVKKAKKVVVVGRPTAGVTDYSNLASEKFEDKFYLMYPTSKSEKVLENIFTYNGIEVDEYIPWSSDHIFKDIDLEKAIKLIEN